MTRGRGNWAHVALVATLLSVTFLATGCVKPVERDDVRMSTTPEQERSAPTQPAVRLPDDPAVEQPPEPAPAVASKQPVQEPPPEEPAAPPAHTASELMGKSQAEVTDLMGAPARVEQRAASTVWVYQGGDCGLDVFFFLDMATSNERVLTVEPNAESAVTAPAASQSAATELTPSAGESATDAQPGKPPEGNVVDVCYGKLRRS